MCLEGVVGAGRGEKRGTLKSSGHFKGEIPGSTVRFLWIRVWIPVPRWRRKVVKAGDEGDVCVLSGCVTSGCTFREPPSTESANTHLGIFHYAIKAGVRKAGEEP